MTSIQFVDGITGEHLKAIASMAVVHAYHVGQANRRNVAPGTFASGFNNSDAMATAGSMKFIARKHLLGGDCPTDIAITWYVKAVTLLSKGYEASGDITSADKELVEATRVASDRNSNVMVAYLQKARGYMAMRNKQPFRARNAFRNAIAALRAAGRERTQQFTDVVNCLTRTFNEYPNVRQHIVVSDGETATIGDGYIVEAGNECTITTGAACIVRCFDNCRIQTGPGCIVHGDWNCEITVGKYSQVRGDACCVFNGDLSSIATSDDSMVVTNGLLTGSSSNKCGCGMCDRMNDPDYNHGSDPRWAMECGIIPGVNFPSAVRELIEELEEPLRSMALQSNMSPPPFAVAHISREELQALLNGDNGPRIGVVQLQRRSW